MYLERNLIRAKLLLRIAVGEVKMSALGMMKRLVGIGGRRDRREHAKTEEKKRHHIQRNYYYRSRYIHRYLHDAR